MIRGKRMETVEWGITQWGQGLWGKWRPLLVGHGAPTRLSTYPSKSYLNNTHKILRSDLRFFPLYCLFRTFPKKHFISLDLEIKIEEQRICVSMGTGHMWASLAWGWTVCDYLHCCPEPWPYCHSIASAFRFNSQAFQEAYPETEFGYNIWDL